MKNHETDSALDGARRGADIPAMTGRDTGSLKVATPIAPQPRAEAPVAASDESATPPQADDAAAAKGEPA